MSSIFTKIINQEIPCHKVAESDTHLAFLDIRPVVAGHTLIVPKKEIDYLFDLPDDLLAETMIFAKKIAKAMDKALNPVRTGVTVEGLEVPHAHVHLIPIYKEGQHVGLGNSIKLKESEMQKIAKQIADEVEL